jgi:RNA-directed DNA polymerase
VLTIQFIGFSAKEAIQKLVKAGFIDNDSFNDTDSGTPQGGIVSLLLVNIALHGIEEELGVSYYQSQGYHKLSRKSVWSSKIC